MEGISPSVPVSLSFVNPVCENSGRMEISRIKLDSDAASLLSDASSSSWDLAIDEPVFTGENKANSEVLILREITENSQLVGDAPESEEDEIFSVGEDPSLISSVELLDPVSLNAGLGTTSIPIEGAENGRIVAKVISFEERSIKRRLCDEPSEESASGPMIKALVVSPKLSSKKDSGKVSSRSIFEDCLPLWGSVSICGHRPEMEDAVMAAPHFMKIPIKMFVGDHGMGGISPTLSHMTSHFFGVYDGHGGSQVANYCRERIHLALVDELKNVKETPSETLWESIFTHCFLKVDNEVGGEASRIIPGEDTNTPSSTSEPVAPETVGSTAVVALVCSSHIVVSNCGDSRAVLYRGREAIALSVDHKPNREDEYARIEASGGKVIQWNGHRVFGVLAMSRSIGDRYLKPWIIPEPEVKFVPRAREDECLVIASDGLWDVMTNEEVCEVVRKRLLIWHKRNGANPLANRGHGVDPAAQEAAEYLSNLALQKGSKDNISIIVVDLKTQRKFKSKA